MTAVAPREQRAAPELAARRRRRTPADAALLALGAGVLLGSWTVLAPADGGYFPRQWLPAGLLCVAAALAAWPALARVRLRSPAGMALLALALFVAWSFASIAWAASPGAAWEASNLWLAIVAGAALAAAVPWTTRTLGAFCAVWVVAVAAVCAVDLTQAAHASDPSGVVIEERFVGVLGYANASAAFAAMAAWPALALAAGDTLPRWARPVLLATCALLIDFALLPVSRGALLALLVAAPLLLLAARPGRLIVHGGVVAVAVAASAPAVLRVRGDEDDPAGIVAALDDAVWAIAASGLAVLAAGLLIAAIGPRVAGAVRLPSPARLRRAGLVVAIVTVAAGAALAATNADRIVTSVQERWDAASAGAPADAGPGRLLSAGPYERPDYWRVAVDAFEAAPILGVGAGGFERRYTAERRYPKHSRYAHNLWLRTLAEGGVVALALLLAAAVAAGAGAVRVARRSTPAGRTVLVACITPAIVFGVHASFDWLEQFLVLAGPAFAFALAALRLADRPRPARSASAARPASAAVGLAGLLALASLGAAWVAVRNVDRGTALWADDRAGALQALHRAERWNPLSPVPALTQGGLALGSGELGAARAAFRRSLEREDTWKARLQLALIAAHDGDFGLAQAHLRRARALDARDPVLAAAAKALRERRRSDPTKFLQALPVSPLFGRPAGA